MSNEPARKTDASRYRLPGKNRSTQQRSIHTPKPVERPPMNSALSGALKVCQDCGWCCLQTITHCLALGGEHAGARHQAILHDCADICETTARFIARESPHAVHLCRECAEICSDCARDCDAMSHGDTVMQHCAQTCRLCAETCLALSSQGGEG